MPALGDVVEAKAECEKVDIVWIIGTAIPCEHPLVLAVGLVGGSFEELIVAGNAADIFWRPATLAGDEARILHGRVTIDDAFDRDRVLPVVTKVVGVFEAIGAFGDKSFELHCSGLQHSVAGVLPLRSRNAVELFSDPEFEEMVILPAHDGLDHVVSP